MKYIKLSIIIATRNRNGLLKKTLISLNTQSYKNNFEVLVCDDGGNSDTDKLVEQFKPKINIKYFWCKDRGGYCWAQAKNYGAKKAQAEYLLFMDDDILIPKNGIEKMYRWLTLLPHRKNKYFITPFSRLYIYDNFFNDLINTNFSDLKKYHINYYANSVSIGCMGLIYKNIFNKIGGFDEILFQGLQLGDTDIIKRLEGFLNISHKTLPLQVYHLDNDAYRNKRNIIAIQRKNIAKQLIREKLHMMDFRMINLDHKPAKDKIKEKEGFYDCLLKDNERIKNISKILRKRLHLYDHNKNYFTPHIRKNG